jgi:hypothetical protein
MTKKKLAQYAGPEDLRHIIADLAGRKFRLDCGHHVTFGAYLANTVVILPGKDPQIICSECYQ